MTVPEVHLTMYTVSVNAGTVRCAGCGKEKVRGLMMGMPRPKWVIGNRTYWCWAKWMKWVRHNPVNRHYHPECAPPGWLSWRIEQAPDIIDGGFLYWGPDVETELMKVISDGLKQS